MNRFTRIAAALAFSIAIAAPAAAQESTPVGSWETTMETPMGNFSATLTVAEEGGAYTVAMAEQMPADMPAMESTISNVAVEGDKVTFDRALTTPQGPMELKYTFTANGDAITGQADSAFGAMAITGTRAAQ